MMSFVKKMLLWLTQLCLTRWKSKIKCNRRFWLGFIGRNGAMATAATNIPLNSYHQSDQSNKHKIYIFVSSPFFDSLSGWKENKLMRRTHWERDCMCTNTRKNVRDEDLDFVVHSMDSIVSLFFRHLSASLRKLSHS